ncbi:hypothetical protein B9T33_11495 [Acinetobacter sp. ANC 5054]|uniref:DUF2460 domain-containing protein n=1 Tax=Acinetobacter sp. ANC 5054 TaxID=1977877 RepID=UPI000A34EE9D|nr:DUF2460 domain-containing protein [Acinetobacter sp. ANC 5054]OTG79754.1 hypothetical protein B9T33_11495 [Acinetobacter sp. ANC 5054]
MSDVLFPELPGLEWELSKTPIFNTKIMTSANGRELRASYQAVPKYEISMSFAFLRESKGRNELQQLEGFFIERRGAFDSFLFKMPEDCEYDCTFVGDGVTKIFQLYRLMRDVKYPLSHVKPVGGGVGALMWDSNVRKPMWYIDDLLLQWSSGVDFTISKDGVLSLLSPIPKGLILRVVGTFYYRCRFADDEQQYTNFMSKLWKANKVEIIGSLGNKV